MMQAGFIAVIARVSLYPFFLELNTGFLFAVVEALV
jgi:hypothetical protein